MLFDEANHVPWTPSWSKGVLEPHEPAWAERSMTMLVVAHKRGFAPQSRGPGGLHGRGRSGGGRHPAELFDDPSRSELQRFLSEVLLIEGGDRRGPIRTAVVGIADLRQGLPCAADRSEMVTKFAGCDRDERSRTGRGSGQGRRLSQSHELSPLPEDCDA